MKKIISSLVMMSSISAFASKMQIKEVILDTGEISALITEPRYPGTQLPLRFDVWGKQDGVCRLLGYEKAVNGSASFGDRNQRVLMLNANGEIESLRSDFNRVSEIVCINKFANANGVELSIVVEPRHPDSLLPVRFDVWGKQDGVCRLLGYEKAVNGSASFGDRNQRVLMLNANGEIESLRSDFNRVTEIVCIKF